MQQVLAVARHALGAICVLDGDARIVFCNDETGKLLQRRKEELEGRHCAELFSDAAGDCPCAPRIEKALAGEPVEPFELKVDGQTRLLATMPLSVRGEHEAAVFLSLYRQQPHRAAPQTLGDPPLTPRETEVLQHLIEGMHTDGIAERMAITRTTVRNHVQRLLRKLGAHSKLEAVAIATRLGLRDR